MEIIAEVLYAPLWSILLTVAAVLWYIRATRTFNTWSNQNVKGGKPWPIFGTLHSILFGGGFLHYDKQVREKYGKVSGGFRGRTPVLDVCDPEFLRLAMIKHFNSMPNRQDRYTGTILDSMITLLSDDRWRHVRSTISPTFTSGKLKQMQSYIDTCGDNLVERIRETDGHAFDCKSYCSEFSMNTMCGTAFGIELNSGTNPDHPVLVNAKQLLAFISNRGNTFLGRMKSIVIIIRLFLVPKFVTLLLAKMGIAIINLKSAKYFANLTAKILSERRRNTSRVHKDFVQICADHLIEDPDVNDPDTRFDKAGIAWSSKGLTQTDITANGLVFFLAGYDTSASTLDFIFYELAMNPEIQSRTYEDITKNMSSDVATYEELSKMEYLDRVINETMRMYPSFPRVERLVAEDITIQGIHLPVVSAMVYAIHHDPDIWPEPSKFNPDRITPENSDGRHQCAWIPFGIGNRNCVGMRLALLKMKIALVKILTNFQLEPCEDTSKKPLSLQSSIRIEPCQPIKVIAKPR